MTDNKNTILAIALSALVLIAWQYFYGIPHEKARQEQLQQQQAKQVAPSPPAQSGQTATQPSATVPPQTPGAAPQVPGAAQSAAPASIPRAEALAASPRVMIDTPSLKGSIALKGGRLDALALDKYHETVAD